MDSLCLTIAASKLCVLDLGENLLVDRNAERLLAACRPVHRRMLLRLDGNELSEEFVDDHVGRDSVCEFHVG